MNLTVKHGVIGGAILFALGFILYIGGPDLSSNMWIGFGIMFFLIIWMIVAGSKVKKANGGSLTFGEGFKAMVLSAAIAIGIGMIASILIHVIIDPDFKYVMAEIITERQIEMMESFGAPADAIDQVIDESSEMYKQFTLPGLLKSNFFFLIFLAVIALIASAIMKKKPSVE